MIVKISDVLQARFKIYEEFIIFGNKSFQSDHDNSAVYLNKLIRYIEDLPHYPVEVKSILIDIIAEVIVSTR